MAIGSEIMDVLVVGGGINGVGVARDAAGRGLKVLLCERGDLAGATSSASSKLVHGGLRYLEHYQFGLVRKALGERSTLLNIAPHIVHPQRFVLPHGRGMRPAWMVMAGLFLYDHLASIHPRLWKSARLDLKSSPEGVPLSDRAHAGFMYADCTVDDARLTVLNAVDAAERGARVLTRTALVSAAREGDLWRCRLRRGDDGPVEEVAVRALINVGGPWARQVIETLEGVAVRHDIRQVKGSHIVVPKMYDGDQAYILQNDDGRVAFVIPFQDDFTLVGTTEVVMDSTPPTDGFGVACSDEEAAYMCAAVNRFFKTQLKPSDAVWSFAGVRPLVADSARSATATTREYVFELDGGEEGQAPVLSVFGGKLTTYRTLAEQVLARLSAFFPDMGPSWTSATALPGGDVPEGGMAALRAEIAAQHPWADAIFVRRLTARHGTRAWGLLANATKAEDLGTDFGHGLFAREVDYLIEREWATEVDDVLWRRTKLGLRFNDAEKAALAAFVDARVRTH